MVRLTRSARVSTAVSNLLATAHSTQPNASKADKNSDGFLTQDEVGDRRWAHIQVADANKDSKISQAELEQAHADGKLGHKHDKS
jgi:hypothetical protein